MATDIVLPEHIIKSLNSLPKEIRVKFWQQLERLLSNPSHPGLRNEKLHGTDQWAFSVTMQYRATYILAASAIVVTAIGIHKDVLGS